jgi:hypothetical protein
MVNNGHVYTWDNFCFSDTVTETNGNVLLRWLQKFIFIMKVNLWTQIHFEHEQ